MIADDRTRDAMHLLEAGQGEAALFTLLGLDETRGEAFRELLTRLPRQPPPPKATASHAEASRVGGSGEAAKPGGHATYQEALAILCHDAEGTCFVYRFSDPTYVMARGDPPGDRPAAAAAPGPPSRSLRRHRAPDPRADRSRHRPTARCLPTCFSGSYGSRGASPHRDASRCVATPISLCRLPARRSRWWCWRMRSPISGTSACSRRR